MNRSVGGWGGSGWKARATVSCLCLAGGCVWGQISGWKARATVSCLCLAGGCVWGADLGLESPSYEVGSGVVGEGRYLLRALPADFFPPFCGGLSC